MRLFKELGVGLIVAAIAGLLVGYLSHALVGLWVALGLGLLLLVATLFIEARQRSTSNENEAALADIPDLPPLLVPLAASSLGQGLIVSPAEAARTKIKWLASKGENLLREVLPAGRWQGLSGEQLMEQKASILAVAEWNDRLGIRAQFWHEEVVRALREIGGGLVGLYTKDANPRERNGAVVGSFLIGRLEELHEIDRRLSAAGPSAHLLGAARLVRTELRLIRQRIQMLRVSPILTADPYLSESEWTAQRATLSEDPMLYGVVERAYSEVERVNYVWRWRRTNATSRLIGINESDNLVSVDQAADEAVAALDEIIEDATR